MVLEVVSFQLNVTIEPTVDVKYCRHSSGAVTGYCIDDLTNN